MVKKSSETLHNMLGHPYRLDQPALHLQRVHTQRVRATCGERSYQSSSLLENPRHGEDIARSTANSASCQSSSINHSRNMTKSTFLDGIGGGMVSPSLNLNVWNDMRQLRFRNNFLGFSMNKSKTVSDWRNEYFINGLSTERLLSFVCVP